MWPEIIDFLFEGHTTGRLGGTGFKYCSCFFSNRYNSWLLLSFPFELELSSATLMIFNGAELYFYCFNFKQWTELNWTSMRIQNSEKCWGVNVVCIYAIINCLLGNFCSRNIAKLLYQSPNLILIMIMQKIFRIRKKSQRKGALRKDLLYHLAQSSMRSGFKSTTREMCHSW